MEATIETVPLARYATYKDSGVEWLGEIPAHWTVRKIKNVADMLISNVDKHSKPLETPVKLCNYTDVYKHDFITSEIKFMKATASEDEINRFKIEINDVLITKDSEDWLDIGIPALVKYEEDHLVCGYHLAILRPKEALSGGFLYQAVSSLSVKTQFSIQANGVTRYGISQGAIKNTVIPLPPPKEQTRIANFLNQKTAQIDQAIAQKERLIELLQERRQVMIHRAVTRGINPDVPMKDSGVEWIGEIPAHWEVKRAKYIFDEINERSESGTEELLSVSHMTGVTLRSEKNISMFMAEDYTGSKLCRKNDLIINIMWAWMGALGVSNLKGIVSPSYGVYRQKRLNTFNSWYLDHLLRDSSYVDEYNRRSTGLHSSRLRLYSYMFFDMELAVPPKEEQDAIKAKMLRNTDKIDATISRIRNEIVGLKELKATLINSAVTGKIKV